MRQTLSHRQTNSSELWLSESDPEYRTHNASALRGSEIRTDTLGLAVCSVLPKSSRDGDTDSWESHHYTPTFHLLSSEFRALSCPADEKAVPGEVKEWPKVSHLDTVWAFIGGEVPAFLFLFFFPFFFSQREGLHYNVTH